MQSSVLLLSLLFAGCYCHESRPGNFCKGLPAGQYCSSSSNGYYNCNGRSSRGILYKCRGHKKCVCQTNKKCVVPRREICQQLSKQLPFAKNYHIGAFAVETVTATDGTVKKQNLHGQAYHNSVTGKFRRERWTGSTNNPNTYRFEYFFLQQSGKYVRVSV